MVIINGKPYKKHIYKNNEQQKNQLLKQHPDAKLVLPETFEPGKSTGANQPQKNQKTNTVSSSVNISSDSSLEEIFKSAKQNVLLPEDTGDVGARVVTTLGDDAMQELRKRANSNNIETTVINPELKDKSGVEKTFSRLYTIEGFGTRTVKTLEEEQKMFLEFRDQNKYGFPVLKKSTTVYEDLAKKFEEKYEDDDIQSSIIKKETKVDENFFKYHNNPSAHQGGKDNEFGWDYVLSQPDGRAADILSKMYDYDTDGDGVNDFQFRSVAIGANSVEITAPNGQKKRVSTKWPNNEKKRNTIKGIKAWMENNKIVVDKKEKGTLIVREMDETVDNAQNEFDEAESTDKKGNLENQKLITTEVENSFFESYYNDGKHSIQMEEVLRDFAIKDYIKEKKENKDFDLDIFKSMHKDGTLYKDEEYNKHYKNKEKEYKQSIDKRLNILSSYTIGDIDKEEYLKQIEKLNDPYYNSLQDSMKQGYVKKKIQDYVDLSIRDTDESKEEIIPILKDIQKNARFKLERDKEKVLEISKSLESVNSVIKSNREEQKKINTILEEATKNSGIISAEKQKKEYEDLFKNSGLHTEEIVNANIEKITANLPSEEDFLKGVEEIKAKFPKFQQNLQQQLNNNLISLDQANARLKDYEEEINRELSIYQDNYNKKVTVIQEELNRYIDDQTSKGEAYTKEFNIIKDRNEAALEKYKNEIFEKTGQTPEDLNKKFTSLENKNKNLSNSYKAQYELLDELLEETDDLSMSMLGFEMKEEEAYRQVSYNGLANLASVTLEFFLEGAGHSLQYLADGKDFIIDKGGDLIGLSEDTKKIISQNTYLLGKYSLFDSDGIMSQNGKSAWSRTIRNIDNWQEKTYKSVIERPVTIEEARTTGNWLDYTNTLFIDQVPILLTISMTGGLSGLAALSLNAAGQDYYEKNKSLDLYERTGGLYGNNYSMSQMLVASTVNGIAEGAFEYTTAKILGKTGSILGLGGKGTKVAGKQILANYTKNSLLKGFNPKVLFRGVGGVLFEQFEEGLAESFTSMTQNFSNIVFAKEGDLTLANIFDGVDEAFISGALIAGTLQAPRVGGLALSPFSSPDTKSAINYNTDRLNQIAKEIDTENSKKSPDLKKIKDLNKQYAELVDVNGKLIELDIKRVDLLSNSEKKTLIEIERKNNNSRKQVKDILKDDSLTKEQKKTKLDKIKNEVNSRSKQKQDILKKYPPNVVDKNYKQQINTLRKMSKLAEKYGGVATRIVIEKTEDNYKERSKKYKAKEKGKTSAQVESNAAHFDAMIEGLNDVINDPDATPEEIQSAKELIKDAENQVRLSNNILQTDSYGVMQPIFEGGKIVGMDIVLNEQAIVKDGMFNTAAHEFIHATFRNTLKADPEMREILGTQLDNILSGDDVQFKPGKRSEFLRKVKSYPIDKQGEEAMAIASEMMFNGDIKFNQALGDKLIGVWRRFAQFHLKRDIKFNNQNDIKNFLIDYHKSISNNRVNPAIARMMAKGAKGKMFKDARTKKQKDSESMFSLAIKKNLDSNPDLKDSFDNFVQNDDGSPKHRSLDDFRASPEFHEGYNKIVDSKLLDGLIRQGMTELGLPAEALKDFTRKVKEEIGIRYLSNYDVTKNDSLFGWLTGISGGAGRSIIYRAKGDVMKQYTREGRAQDVSIDKQIGEAGTIADVIKADKDALMDQIDNVDMTPTRKRDLKNTIQDLKMAMEILNLPNDVRQSIIETVNAADVDLKGLSYKGIRDLLISTETKATTEKKATPTGPLFGVLNAIAAEFGIDPLRILAKQDLSSEQRVAAQQYIFNKAVNEDGTLNKDFVDMLPEGQDRSGRSTGIANTKLGEFYTKGQRAKMRAGATAAGLATQTKRTNITKAEFLNLFGINQDGTLQPGRKADGAIRELVVQLSALTANQQIRINAVNNSIAAESDIARIRDGMSESMFSEKLNNNEGNIEGGNLFQKLTNLQKQDQKKHLNIPYIVGVIGNVIDDSGNVVKLGQFAKQDKKGAYKGFKMIDLDAPYIDVNGKKTNITTGEYLKKVIKKILEIDPRAWQVLFTNMTGSVKRQSLMTRAHFIKEYGPDPTLDKNGKYNEAKYGPPLFVDRIKYTDKPKGSSIPVQDKQVIDNYKESDYKRKIPALIETFKVFERLLDPVNGNPEYHDFLALMISDTINNTASGATRIAAPTYFVLINPITGKIDYITEVVEEHATPQKKLVANVLFNAAKAGAVDQVAPLIESYFKQGGLAKLDDIAVGQNYGSDMPAAFYNSIIPMLQSGTFPSDLKDFAFLIRYSSPHKIKSKEAATALGVEVGDTYHINLNKYVVLAGKHKGKTFTEVFGVGMKGETSPEINAIQNELINLVLTGEITTEQAKSEFDRLVPENVKSYYQGLQKDKIKIENEIEQQRLERESSEMMSSKKTPKVQGLSVFDFDDTLGITKSGVLVKVPNLDGDPKPNRKVVFLAGGAGSGKSNVVKKLKLQGQGFKIVNSDISLEWLKKNSGLPADMKDLTKEQRSTLGKLGAESRKIARRKMMKYQGNGNGVIIDGTGGSMKQMQKLVKEFQDKGYDVSMLFVETSLETALDRNRKRKERTLLDSIVKRNHESVQNNKQGFKEMFGDNFMEVSTDNLTVNDPMPIELVSKMNAFTTSYEKLRIDATEFAEQGDALLEQGAEFDFTEFDQVVEGRPGPLLGKALERAKKYGTKDIFVLTARTQKSAEAIQQFLKSQGLDIPIENITGLANSTGDAKAQWMLGKFAEGYNDMYFADDALQNVEAVKEVLNQLDIKSDVVQAKLDQTNRIVETDSESMESKIIEPDINDPNRRDPIDKEFNDMIERKKKVDSAKIFTEAEARKRGSEGNIARFIKSLYIPPSAEDFKGLLYYFVGKGKQGDLDLKFFKEKLLDPFAKGIRSWNAYKQNMVVEYKALNKKFKDVVKSLNEKVPGSVFTVDNAIRVYLYDKAGHSIPGISEAQKRKLIKHVESNPSLQAYADGLSKITRVKEGYPEPTNNWYVGSIPADMNNLTGKIGRRQFIQNWINNKDIIFSKDNLNKIRATYGDNFADALENILYRMENGGNRTVSKDKLVNKWMDWINGSVGAIMFFNMRSALLQTISTVNFINWSDNNIFKAAGAFANQPQFWKDFAMLFNSPMLKQRRAGLATDVSASELQRTFKEGGNSSFQKGQAVIRYLLQIGFTPTQIADSFAIALGGASFYRNRFKKYIKEGMTSAQANEQAMLDFQEIAEETQQSSREDLISQQQASVLGRMILAFQNVTMQMGRLTKKALSDLKNGRGDFKTNVSKIIYYGVVQNIIFASLQSALAMIMWGDDEEEITARTERAANQALDSFLRGTGIYGAIISTIKNTMIQWSYQKQAKFGREKVEKIILEAISISPPIGAKARKIASAYYSDKYNEDIKMGIRVDNPRLKGYATLIEAVTNIPLARIMNKANNIEEAITGDHLLWQKAAMLMGWNRWDLGLKDEEVEEAREEAKETKKEKKKIEKIEEKKKEEEEKKKKGIKTVRCSGIRSNGTRCKMTTETTAKTFLCVHHAEFKDGMDRDGDGIKEYRCTAIKSNGQRCKNKTENKNKKCYAHQ